MTIPQTNTPQYFGKDLEAMSFAKNYHDWIMSELSPYLGDSVAEVGAGIGDFSKLLLAINIKSLKAYEPSQNMYPALQEALSQDVRVDTINGVFGCDAISNSFDSVLYVNVLEHIDDDALELTRAYNALSESGHLLIFVPALPWLFSDFDKNVGHFRRYLKTDLTNLVQTAGFNIVKAHYFDIAGVIPWYINFVLLKNSMLGGSVSIYDKLVIPPMRLIEKLIPPPIGKNLLLVARK